MAQPWELVVVILIRKCQRPGCAEKHWKKVLPAACKNGIIKKVYIQQDNLSPLQCHVKEIFIREEF